MIKPLVIAYPFLHESDACGRIEQQFFSKLPRSKYSPTIVCSERRGDELYGKEFNKVVIPESKLVFDLFRVANRLKIADAFFQPDYQKIAWAKKVLAIIEKEIDCKRYDYIHTINMPCSAHLIGLELKRKYGKPWVAQFYDPWYNNPYRQEQMRIHRADEVYEKEVAMNADLILHSNQLMIDDWKNLYGDMVENKISLLPYIIDDRERDTSESNSEVLTISHIGNLQRGRQSFVFIKAIAKIVLSNPELKGKIRVNYVGTTTDSEKEEIRRNGLEEVFNITGRITDIECNQYFAKSDMFLAIDTEHLHNVFFPSKLLNYFYYGKPIIGLCQKESVLRTELTASHNFVFDYDDIEGLASFLRITLNDKNVSGTNDKSYWEKFSQKEVIGQYEALIERLPINKGLQTRVY